MRLHGNGNHYMSKMIATCCSTRCTSATDHILNKTHFAIKEVKSGFMCPDCGYALRWVKKKTEKYRTVSKRSPIRKSKADYDLNQHQ